MWQVDLPQKKRTDQIMKLGQVIRRQFLIFFIQFGSIDGRIEELKEIEQLSLVVLERCAWKVVRDYLGELDSYRPVNSTWNGTFKAFKAR
jgi:hypothetical protein